MMLYNKKCVTLQSRFKGEVLEWLKRHAWKACIPLKGIGGSNPPLSAYESCKFFLLTGLFVFMRVRTCRARPPVFVAKVCFFLTARLKNQCANNDLLHFSVTLH